MNATTLVKRAINDFYARYHVYPERVGLNLSTRFPEFLSEHEGQCCYTIICYPPATSLPVHTGVQVFVEPIRGERVVIHVQPATVDYQQVLCQHGKIEEVLDVVMSTDTASSETR